MNKEELIEFIGTTVASRFESSQSPTNGALLAELIRAKFPGHPIVDAAMKGFQTRFGMPSRATW